MTTPHTTFTFRGGTHQTEQDATFLELARLEGLLLPSLCGGRGKCAKCRCHPRGPVTDPTPLELELLSEAELSKGIRLACQARPVCAECIGFQDLRAGLDVFGVDFSHHVGRRQVEFVETAVERYAPVVQTRPHRAVEDDQESLRRAQAAFSHFAVDPAGSLRIIISIRFPER
jgi:ferredoxin